MQSFPYDKIEIIPACVPCVGWQKRYVTHLNKEMDGAFVLAQAAKAQVLNGSWRLFWSCRKGSEFGAVSCWVTSGGTSVEKVLVDLRGKDQETSGQVETSG